MAGVEERARGIGAGLGDEFARFARGEIGFEHVTHQAFLALYELRELHPGGGARADHPYDRAEATASQEDLAQEPAREER